MNKSLYIGGVALAMLLAACSQPTESLAPEVASSAASLTIRAEQPLGDSVRENTAIVLVADTDANEAVLWHSSAGILLHNEANSQDPQNHRVTFIVPDASHGTVEVEAHVAGVEVPLRLAIADSEPRQRLQFVGGSSILLTEQGSSRALQAQLLNANGKPVPSSAITFTSSNPEAIHVEATSGQAATVQALGDEVSSAIITARYQGLEAHAVVMHVALHEGTHFVQGDVVQAITDDGAVLSRNAVTESLAVGDLIVSDGDYGLNDRITALTVHGDNVVITTEEVSTSETYEAFVMQGSIPSTKITTQVLGEGHAIFTSEGVGGELLSQTVLDDVSCKYADGRAANLGLEGASITLDTTISTDIDIQGGSLWSAASLFKVVSDTTTALAIDSGRITFNDVSGDEVSCAVYFPLTSYDEFPLITIGPWCFGINFVSHVLLTASGVAENDTLVVDNPFEGYMTQTARTGFVYSGGNWEKISELVSHDETFAEPSEADFDTTQSFSTRLSASASHKAYLNIQKAHSRLVSSFEFYTLHSAAIFEAQHTLCQAGDNGDDVDYPDPYSVSTQGVSGNAKEGQIDWAIDVVHQGALPESLATRNAWNRNSLQNFARWQLGITAPFGSSTPSHTVSEGYAQGSIATDSSCNSYDVPY